MDTWLKFLGFLSVIAAFIGVPMVLFYVIPPLGRAIGRRLEGTPVPSDELSALRSEVEELRALASRVPELEERVDFAERMLAQGREPSRLEG